MIWFILSILCIFLFIISFTYGQRNEWPDDGLYVLGVIISILIVVGTFIVTLNINLKYLHKVEQFKVYETTIKNKVASIKEIRKAFIKTSAPLGKGNKINNAFSIDMVNKDLTKCLSDGYRDLEQYIKDINDIQATWQYKYNNRIWTICYIKPLYDAPLNISDYFK